MNLINKNKILIIGAGISGISCANRLLTLNPNYDITIFEASDRYGGRLKTLNNFASYGIELGGEEIHGRKSEYYNLVNQVGGKTFGYWDENLLYTIYKGEWCSLEESKIEEVKRVSDLFEEVSYELNKDYEDETLRSYLDKNSFAKDSYYLANAMFGVEAGTDLDKVSIGGFSQVNKNWEAGGEKFLLQNMTHMDVIEKAYAKVITKIKLNSPITAIDYTNNQIKLIDSNQNEYIGDKCILSVPITQLKNNKINLIPTLPEDQLKAINSIKIDNCAKLILKLKKQFWPNNTGWLLLEGNVNLYWPTSQGKTSDDIILSALVTGQGCDNLQALYKESKETFIECIIIELERGFKLTDMKDNIIDYHWHNWATIPFIEGGYSYPSVGEGDSRAIGGKSIENKLFFAGEAFAKNGHIATIHGAMERGIDVANEIHEGINSN